MTYAETGFIYENRAWIAMTRVEKTRRSGVCASRIICQNLQGLQAPSLPLKPLLSKDESKLYSQG
ncbi:MAG: hypothetical protein ACMG55_10500, partial [Microcoleus sp.]